MRGFTRSYIFLLIIILFGFFLRFYKLGDVPYGFYQDESAIGYNAYSILKTGKDEHGKFLPVYFKSFGDYKLPLYIYLTSLTVFFGGLTEFAVRFPSALFGTASIGIFYLLVLKLMKNDRTALLSALLLAINPWHLHYSRATFEVTVALFFFLLGSYLLLTSFQENKNGFFAFGVLCFVLNTYSYNLTRLLSPALLCLILYSFKNEISKISRAETAITILLTLVFFFPLAQTIREKGGISSSSGTLIFTSAVVQAPLHEFRSYMNQLPSTFTKVFFNSWLLTFWQYLKNIVSFISADFFFVRGSLHGNHGIGSVGQFYLFEVITILWGIIKVIKEKNYVRKYLVIWTFITISIAALTRESPHATRSFFLLFPLIIFSAVGLKNLLSYIKNIMPELTRYSIYLVLCALGLYNTLYYFSSYYFQFPALYAKSWRSADKPVSLFINKRYDEYDKILIDKDSGLIYTSLLFFTKFQPDEFQATAIRTPDDSEGFSEVTAFGKYEIRSIDWNNDIKQSKTLIITTADRKPKEVPPLEAFYYPRKPVAFAVKQQLVSYPIEEIAYVVVSTDKSLLR